MANHMVLSVIGPAGELRAAEERAASSIATTNGATAVSDPRVGREASNGSRVPALHECSVGREALRSRYRRYSARDVHRAVRQAIGRPAGAIIVAKGAMDFAEQVKGSVDIVERDRGARPAAANRGHTATWGCARFTRRRRPRSRSTSRASSTNASPAAPAGDVFKFVMEIEGLSFYEALKSLAERNGIPMPKRSQYADEDSRAARRAARDARTGAGEFPRESERRRRERRRARTWPSAGCRRETIEQFGLGYSDRSGRALLRLFEQRDFPAAQIEQSGLVGKREDGSMYDRFRNRLMFPIHNEAGKIIGFGGRALAAEDNPKYLNSPETPIYKKSHVLYNLHRAKEAMRKEDRAILVEGYMDAIGVTAAGFGPVVASCGTALTPQQVKLLKQHTQRIVVNFDPDAAGANAAERSINLLLEEGMQVRILELDGDLDPDEYCKERGAAGVPGAAGRRQGLLLLAGGPGAREVRCADVGGTGRGAEVSACRRCSASPTSWSAW